MPLNPTPIRQRIRTFLTPSSVDYIVAESKDVSFRAIPAYGTAHPDSAKYPNHLFCYAAPADDQGLLYTLLYAMPRSNQDAYNFGFAQADIGGERFDSVVRTYVTLRSSYNPTTPAQGSTMPNVPAGLFTGSYVLSGRKEIRSDDKELDSIFVMEQLVWVKRTTLYEVENDEMLGVGQGKSVNLYYRGENTGGGNIEALIANPSSAYWGVQTADGTVRTGQQLTSNWFAVTTYSSLDAALEAYTLSFPSSVDLDLPDELLGVQVVWNRAGSNGEFASEAAGRSAYVGDPEVSLALSEAANAECGGSIQPEIIPNIRTRKGRDIPSTAYFFFIKAPTLNPNSLTSAQVLAKLATIAGAPVFQWPLFKPVQHTFVLTGQRGAGRAQVSASGSVSTQYSTTQERNNKEVSSAKGSSYDYSTSIGTVVLPPTIHGTITLGNSTPPDTIFTADCSAEWSSGFTPATVAGFSIALPTPGESGPGTLDPSAGSTGSVSETATVTLAGSVEPTSLGAVTSPTSIPITGLYLVGSTRIEPYKARWFRVAAQVVDATIFIP